MPPRFELVVPNPDAPSESYEIGVDLGSDSAPSQSISVQVVRDLETGDVVQVTPEMRARAAAARRLIEQATLAKALALATVADERLYLADGYGSFKDWVLLELGSSYTSAKEYVKIGRRVAPLFPALAQGDGLAGSLPELTEGHPSGLDSERVDAISGLGYKKLAHLVRLDEARFADVVERGVVTLDGEDFTLDDLQDMSSREVAARVRDELAPLKDALAEARARAETLEAEKQALLDEQDAQAAELADARALEAELRPRAQSIEAKRAGIGRCHDQVNRLNTDLVALAVDVDDPATLQHDLVALLAKLDDVAERVRHHYQDVQAALIGLDS